MIENLWYIFMSKHHIYRPVENFSTIIVDDFFDDPDSLVAYGKSLPKKPAPNGFWPGVRSEFLWRIDDELHTTILAKILSCYFNLDNREVTWDHSQMYFQEMPRFSDNKNDVKNKGWIHRDDQQQSIYAYPDMKESFDLAGLIYLTPKIDPDSGTSLFKLKDDIAESGINLADISDPKQMNIQYMKQNSLECNELDEQELNKQWNLSEDLFIETTRIQNIFNRAIMYDTAEWHKANSYYNADGEDARFNLVFFIGGLSEIALHRTRNTNYDSVIKRRCVSIRN